MAIKIIAELAQGYEGSAELARLLVKAAAKTGADAIKIQCIFADELATPGYKHYRLFKQLEMEDCVWSDLSKIAHESGKEFYVDVFGEKSLELAISSGADAVKIHSTDFFNNRLVDRVFGSFNKILVAIGGIRLEEMRKYLSDHSISGKDVCFMFGHQTEPTPITENNIRRLMALKMEELGVSFGFMDHSEFCSNEALTLSLLVLPLNVRYIEKHMTLDHKLALEDHISAITPTEFDMFIDRIRKHELALGSDSFALGADDLKYRSSVIKVVVLNRDMLLGQEIGLEDIALKRIPGGGNDRCFYFVEDILGKKINKAKNTNDPIYNEDLE